MTTAERRLREKARRETTIMDAAERLFFAKGPDSTSMDEIADAAELSKGLLYFYFKSKEDLVHSIVHRGLSILGGFFQQALSENQTGIEQARAIGRAYIRFSQEYPNYFGLMASFESMRKGEPEPGTYQYDCQKQGQHVLGLVAEAVVNGIEDGTIRSDLDPEVTAVMLWGLTHGIITISGYKKHGPEPRIEPELLIETTLDFIRRGLSPAEIQKKILAEV